MKKLSFLLLLCLFAIQVNAQKVWTKTGEISFYSEAPLENIEAENHSVSSVIDTKTGDVVFSLLISAFEFEKALMQEHFNEKYLHSDKYPKSTFKGKITNLDDVDFNAKGEHTLDIEGELTIHGKTNDVNTTMTITVEEAGSFKAVSSFSILLSDYDIEIPNMVKDNISKTIDITVSMNYEPFNK